MKDIVVNGKTYPMWQQFVQRKDEWIGGILEDFGDLMDQAMGYEGYVKKITDIRLEPNGETSAMFSVESDEFNCGFDVEYGGVAAGEEGWLTFSGPMGHSWRIKQKLTAEKELKDE